MKEDVQSIREDVAEIRTEQAKVAANQEYTSKAVDTLSEKIDSGFERLTTTLVDHDKALTRIHDDKMRWQRYKGWAMGITGSLLTLVGKYIYTLLTGLIVR